MAAKQDFDRVRKAEISFDFLRATRQMSPRQLENRFRTYTLLLFDVEKYQNSQRKVSPLAVVRGIGCGMRCNLRRILREFRKQYPSYANQRLGIYRIKPVRTLLLEDSEVVPETDFYNVYYREKVRLMTHMMKLGTGKRKLTDLYVLCRCNHLAGTVVFYGISYNSKAARLLEDESVSTIGFPEYVRTVNHRLGELWKREQNMKAITKTGKLQSLIGEWLERCSFAGFYEEIEKSVHGQNELRKLLANVYVYLQGIAMGKMMRNNMLLAAPSGCGKTETYRALRQYFSKEIPELIISLTDLSQITPIGFRGASSDDILADFLGSGQTYGIVFLDEIDKKLMPQYADRGENLNASVQAQLLTMIEGREMSGCDGTINTSNILFIGLGCFDFARRSKIETSVKRTIGFCNQREEKIEYYEGITREDMITAGASYEFVGRFKCIVNYGKLDSLVIDQIIREETARLEKHYGVEIELSEDIQEYLHSVSNLQYGCRSISNVLTSSFLSAYPDYLQSVQSSKTAKEQHIRLVSENRAEIV